MTATAERSPAAATGADAGTPTQRPAAPGRPVPRPQRPDPRRTQQARVLGGTLLLIAVVLLGFVGYLFGLSRLSEQRSQNTMYKTFAGRLAQAVAPVGTSATTGPIAVGTPVAIVDAPSVGISHLVVVEGTDARQLTRGPGHRRDTPLPGQAGVSVLYGRRATFGGPFSALPNLTIGALIYVTTGQGVSTYKVAAFGTSARPPQDTAADRLVLVTADSAWMPHSTITVSADLTSKVQPSPGGLPAIGADEHALAGAPATSVLPLMLWGQALLVVAVVATIGVRRWSKWPAYLCFAPIALAVLWNVYENAATFLPNVW